MVLSLIVRATYVNRAEVLYKRILKYTYIEVRSKNHSAIQFFAHIVPSPSEGSPLDRRRIAGRPSLRLRRKEGQLQCLIFFTLFTRSEERVVDPLYSGVTSPRDFGGEPTERVQHMFVCATIH
jgi:hypothetical protein